jgi:cell division protein FtsI/penicillin-binding protein 2
MWRKRAVGLLVLLLCLIGLLMGRLTQIQLVQTKDFSGHGVNLLEASVKQRSQEMVIDNGRGTFLDRNGEPLIQERALVLVLFPFLKSMNWDSDKLVEVSGISKSSLLHAIEEAKAPFAYGDPDPLILTEEQREKINELKIPGVFAIERKYSKANYPAEQLIGITGENEKVVKERYPNKSLSPQTLIGLTGLEKSFDEFLLSDGNTKLVYHVDGNGGPLFGINVKYVGPANPFYPVNIKTTLDTKFQELGEELADKHQISKGGLVLLDIDTNSVLAMVSRPKINKDAPFDSKSSGIQNMMTTQQIPGSVFKTVVAAATIDYEMDDPNRTFDCNKKINGEQDANYQYGQLNFSESFARSCNNTFGTLAKELKQQDENTLETYAKKLSLLGTVGWTGDVYHFDEFKQLPDEDKGRVFLEEKEKTDNNYVALSGIGQHEVRVTPLAVANMMSTIARGGEKSTVRVAFSIEYKNGTPLTTFDNQKLTDDSLSPYTAMKLQKLLREVVINEHGTGRWFQNLPYQVAGKSGTAETGVFENGKQLHNKWFAGYFPYEKPQYALVVVNLGVAESEGGVNPLFADMVKGIYDIENNQ